MCRIMKQHGTCGKRRSLDVSEVRLVRDEVSESDSVGLCSVSVMHGSKYLYTVVLLYAIDFHFTDGET